MPYTLHDHASLLAAKSSEVLSVSSHLLKGAIFCRARCQAVHSHHTSPTGIHSSLERVRAMAMLQQLPDVPSPRLSRSVGLMSEDRRATWPSTTSRDAIAPR